MGANLYVVPGAKERQKLADVCSQIKITAQELQTFRDALEASQIVFKRNVDQNERALLELKQMKADLLSRIRRSRKAGRAS